MTQLERMTANEARAAAQSRGGSALLICAYSDEEKCRRLRLEGALTLQELEARESGVDDNRLLVFYCN